MNHKLRSPNLEIKLAFLFFFTVANKCLRAGKVRYIVS